MFSLYLIIGACFSLFIILYNVIFNNAYFNKIVNTYAGQTPFARFVIMFLTFCAIGLVWPYFVYAIIANVYGGENDEHN